jgi:hypothetical protein
MALVQRSELPPFNLQTMNEHHRRFLVRDIKWNDILVNHQVLSRSGRYKELDFISKPKRPPSSLGRLDRLPLEVLHNILSNCTIPTTHSFRQVNSTAHAAVHTWPPFLRVQNFGSIAIDALMRIGGASLFTYTDVESVVFSCSCELCFEHAEILYLPKLMRCCFHCLSTDRRLLVIPLSSDGLTLQRLEIPWSERLTIFQTIPQDLHYGHKLGRYQLIDYTTAAELCQSSHAAKARCYPPSGPPFAKWEVLPVREDVPAWYHDVKNFEEAPSLQERRKRSLPQLPLLSLPWLVVRPLENYSDIGPTACSIRLQPFKTTSGFSKKEVQMAWHCSGCAHFWHLHSRLPWEYHRMYRGSK